MGASVASAWVARRSHARGRDRGRAAPGPPHAPVRRLDEGEDREDDPRSRGRGRRTPTARSPRVATGRRRAPLRPARGGLPRRPVRGLRRAPPRGAGVLERSHGRLDRLALRRRRRRAHGQQALHRAGQHRHRAVHRVRPGGPGRLRYRLRALPGDRSSSTRPTTRATGASSTRPSRRGASRRSSRASRRSRTSSSTGSRPMARSTSCAASRSRSR